MPVIKRPLNPLGLWLNNELGKRGMLLSDFASKVGTTPQNLSDIMRGTTLSDTTMERWEERFKTKLQDKDDVH